MVNNIEEEQLTLIFRALADPTRRGMLQLLTSGDKSISELAEPFEMSLVAASKHVKVLERARLLERSIAGRTHCCRLNGDTLSRASQWLDMYERFWDRRFDLLEQELLKEKRKEH
ncbi:ArsR/SmtB family transcription factor [Paenibacillus pasadenensis]|uniref:ArsR/SmtB family transcription factor n=1 Tax=Paenibacillus pasadenensis TaxID=217090 RepID=UPI00255A2BC6|nr:metalloregulator ArsR/SmtB family transcription factor [Paenibacillus pasadenensis]